MAALMRQVTLQPKEVKTVHLGERSLGTPRPELKLEFAPNSPAVGSVLSQTIESERTYSLAYHFQNDSRQTFNVMVWDYSDEMA